MTSTIKEKIAQNLERSISKANKYNPSNYDGNIILLTTKNSAKVPNLAENYCWEEIAKSIKTIQITGNHMELFDEKYIKSTARAIQRAYWSKY